MFFTFVAFVASCLQTCDLVEKNCLLTNFIRCQDSSMWLMGVCMEGKLPRFRTRAVDLKYIGSLTEVILELKVRCG